MATERPGAREGRGQEMPEAAGLTMQCSSTTFPPPRQPGRGCASQAKGKQTSVPGLNCPSNGTGPA